MKTTFRYFVVAIVISAFALKTSAATLTWTGLAGDGNLNNSANWSPAQVPAGGDVLVFSGTGGNLSTATGLNIGTVSFSASAGIFALAGLGSVTLGTGGIASSATNQEIINNNITLGAAQTWNGGTGGLVINGNVSNGGRLLTLSGTTVINGNISGAGGITKSGAGIASLTGSNSYTGVSTLSGGTLQIGNNSALGTGGLTLNGGIIQGDGTSRTLSNSITLATNSTVSGTSSLTFTGRLTESGGNRTLTVDTSTMATFSGGILLSDSKKARTMTFSGIGNATVASVISNGNSARNGSIIKAGNGTLTLSGSGANTFVGTTTVNAGTLILGKTFGNAIPGNLTIGDGTGIDTVQLQASEQIVNSSVVTLNSSGVLDLNGNSETIARITGSGSITFGNGGSLLFGATGSSWTLAAVMSGAGGFVKNGTGTLTLSGASMFSGTSILNAGTITLGIANAFSANSNLKINGNASTLNLAAYNTSLGDLEMTGGKIQATTGRLNLYGDVTAISTGGVTPAISCNITLAGDILFTVNIGGAASDLTLSAPVSGTGYGITKAGTGILRLTATNTYTGTTTINAGTLQIAGGSAIADNNLVVLANQAGATFDLANSSETIGGLSGGGSLGGNVILGTGTLTLGGNSSSTTFAGSIAGTGGLVKTGTGILTLAGNNTYTGSTMINAGILRVSGGHVLPDTSSVTLSNTTGVTLDLNGSSESVGNLSGGGILGGNVTLGGGILTTGLANGNVTYSGVISGNGSVLKSGTGTWTLNATHTFSGTFDSHNGITLLTGTAGSITGASSVIIDTGATLTLDNSIGGNSNRIADSTPVTLQGGTFKLISGTSGSTETVGALNPSSGASNVLLVHNGAPADQTTLIFSSLGMVGAGATVNFGATGGTLGAASTGPRIFLLGQPLGFIGGWATTGTDFATYTANGIQAYAGYYTGASGINVNDPTKIVLLASTSPVSAYTLTNPGTTTDSGLNLTDNSLVDLGTDPARTLNLASGGLLKSTTASTTISGAGHLSAGGTSAGALSISMDTSGYLTIASTITNNAGKDGIYGNLDDGVVSLAMGGTGLLVLSGSNSFTGGVYLNSGTTVISSEINLGNPGNSVTFGGGTLKITAGFTASSGKTFIVSSGFTGTFDIAADQVLTLGNSTNLLISQNATGTLIKTGPGTMILPNANPNFDAGVQIISGTMELQNAQALGDSTNPVQITLIGGALTLRNNTAMSLANHLVLASDAGVEVDGTGITHSFNSLALGANTLNISSPTGATLGFGSTILNGNATLNTTAGATVNLGAISGAFGFTKSGPGILLMGAGSYIGPTSLNAGTIRFAANNAGPASSAVTVAAGADLDLNNFNGSIGSLAGSGTVTLGTGTLAMGYDNSSTIFSGAITGAGGITKTGTGTWTLSGNTSYLGPTQIAAGSLQLNASGVIPDSSPVTVAGGALLDLNNFNETVGSLAGSGNVNLGSGLMIFGGNNTSTIFSGLIAGSGSLTKTGTGTMSLQSDSTYTGTTLVSAGALNIQSNGALGDTLAGTVVASGAELQIQNNIDIPAENTTLNGQGLAGGGSLHNISGDNSWAGNITAGSATTIGSDSGSLDILGNINTAAYGLTLTGSGDIILDGTISGSGGITKNGIGTLFLTSFNTYAGVTLIIAGTIEVQDGSALGVAGAGNDTIISSGAALRLNDSVGITVGENITLNGDGPGGAGSVQSVFGTNILSGTMTLGSSSTISVTADSLELTGRIIESVSNSGLTKQGTGTLILTGSASYTGPTLIASGTLQLGASQRIPDTSALTISTGAIFDLNNFDETVGSLSGSGSTILGSATLTTGSDNTSTIFSGSISGSGGFVKIGTGTLTLSGNSTYSGTTSLAGGKVIVSGSISGNVIVHNGATLAGSGAVGNLSVQAQGIVAPGNTAGTPGTLYAGSGSGTGLDLNSGSQLTIELGGTAAGASDRIVVAAGSGISLAGQLNGSLINGYQAASGTTDLIFIIVNNGSAITTGSFSNQFLFVGVNTVQIGNSYFFVSYTASFVGDGSPLNSFTGGNDVALLSVPEPGTPVILIAGLAMQCFFLRRRTRPAPF